MARDWSLADCRVDLFVVDSCGSGTFGDIPVIGAY